MRLKCRISKSRIRSKYRRRIPLLVLLFLFILLSAIPVHAEDAETGQKQVLFINSYGYDFETVPVVIKEVSEKLSGAASIQYLFMNEKYTSDDEASARLREELNSMTAEFHYSAVILGDDAALDFAVRYRDTYFKNIPLIYEDINSIEKAEKYNSDPLINGVVEAFPMKETIALAKTIQKDAVRVVVITDNSVSGAGSAQQAMKEQSDFPDMKFELFDTSTMDANAIQKNIAAYGNDSILLYTVFNVDGSGTRYTLAQGVKLITDAARVPVFKADEAGLGSGLAGGYVLSYQSIGKETAELVLSVLNGGDFKNSNYKMGTCIYKFDQKVLDKYHISRTDLPNDSVYINESPDFFETHRTAVILLICCSAALLLTVLLKSERGRRELNRKLEIEEAAGRAKTEFISKMSHDIRTPLNAVLGMDSLALQEVNNPAKVQEYLKKAISSGELLTSLINDVLDISRIESGRMKLNLSAVKLGDFLKNIRNVFDSICAEKNIAFTLTENAGDAAVAADRVRLNQILYNLLANAVKFTDAGGKIGLALETRPQDGSLDCIFTVSDTGCGMSKEFQKHMFEQFTQEERKNSQGSGLGLSIVKSLVDLMGGRINIDSAPGEGTVFHVYLTFQPAEAASKNHSTGESATDISCLSGKHVLLAEDNALNAQITQLMLENAGMTMDLAEDGEKAVECFAAAPEGYYALILMDNRMPGTSGMEATRAIRKLNRPDAADIPIIAVTADAFEDDSVKFRESGMNDCLTKPLDQDKLVSMLVKYCK